MSRTLIIQAGLVLLLTAPAAAQERQNMQQAMQGGGMTEDRELDDQRAREHFQIARRYYNEGRFREAALQFEEAYELSRRADLLYNAYIGYRDAHESRDAARTLERYLALTPDAPDRVNLEARLDTLQEAIAEEEQSEQELESAQATADAERTRAEAEARRRAEAEAAPEVWPWVILGVGAATVIGGAVVGGIALGDSNALLEMCTEGRCRVTSQENLDEMRDGAKNLALAADILMFGGGAIAVTGLILGLIFGVQQGAEEAPAEGEVEARLDCGVGFCGGQLRGSF